MSLIQTSYCLDKGTLLSLLEKFRHGECTREEEALLYEWMDALEQDQTAPVLSHTEMQQLKKDMLHAILPAPPSRKRFPVIRMLRIAAAMVPLIAGGYLAQRYYTSTERTPEASIAWRTIQNNSDALHTTFLPDSTTAILSPYSTIQVPAQFPGNDRPVKLVEGKVFFDVTKDQARPFSVTDNSGVRTTVLGTSFTIEAIKAFNITRIAVASGKVQVARDGLAPATLGPSQRLTFSEHAIKQDSVAAADLLAWTRGEIILRNATLQDLLLTIKNQYGVTATTTLDLDQGNYTLRIPANMKLQEVLDIIEKISYRPKIHFSMQKDQLLVI